MLQNLCGCLNWLGSTVEARFLANQCLNIMFLKTKWEQKWVKYVKALP